jgi:hypothetical protein
MIWVGAELSGVQTEYYTPLRGLLAKAFLIYNGRSIIVDRKRENS